MGIKHGVVVTASSNPAAERGIRRGDVILRIDNSDVSSAQDFQNQLEKLGKKKKVMLLIARNNMITYIPFKPAAAK